ncbi:hypothetical protein PspLS_04379 [Pyricularia sp. CBS 133598]|nr:hypothetical protein PspLS_04379 [Pyricularia sp. CBS 133598]
MQFNFITITLALVVTSYAATMANTDCKTLSIGQDRVCPEKARPVLCGSNAFLGTFGGCCPDNGCGVAVSSIYI